MLTMTMHSHLYTDEIIAWIAGKADEDVIEIKQLFQVHAIQHENGRINVKMDAEDADQVRKLIGGKGM